MSTRTYTLLASLALVVFLLSGNPWQAAPGNSSGPVLGPPFVASLWSQDDRTVVAASDKDAEDADTDKKEPPEGKDDEDPRLKELWDSPMLG